MNKFKLINKHEIIIIALFFVSGVVFHLLTTMFSYSDDVIARIYSGKEVYKIINLKTAENEIIYVNELQIEIKNSEIRFINSPCKDKLCVKAGFIKNPYQLAVCLPQRVAITLSSGKNKDYDTITY